MEHDTPTLVRLFFFCSLDCSYLYVPLHWSRTAEVELSEQ